MKSVFYFFEALVRTYSFLYLISICFALRYICFGRFLSSSGGSYGTYKGMHCDNTTLHCFVLHLFRMPKVRTEFTTLSQLVFYTLLHSENEKSSLAKLTLSTRIVRFRYITSAHAFLYLFAHCTLLTRFCVTRALPRTTYPRVGTLLSLCPLGSLAQLCHSTNRDVPLPCEDFAHSCNDYHHLAGASCMILDETGMCLSPSTYLKETLLSRSHHFAIALSRGISSTLCKSQR